MITSMISPMISPMITSMVNPDGGGVSPVFSPLTASYSSATFTPVVTTNTEIISFHVKGLTASATVQYFMSDTTAGSYLFYRGSDGRFRIRTDAGLLRTVNYTGLNDGGSYFVEIRVDPNGWDLYVDGGFQLRATGTMDTFTVSAIGDSAGSSMTLGAIYGVTLGGAASWPMQSTSDDVFDGADMIGANDLTYNGAPVPVTSSDTIETVPL